MVELSQKGMVQGVTKVFAAMTDPRKGRNSQYLFTDICLAAFGSFFLQSPSFLAYQRAMQERIGRNNARSLFGISDIPTDDQIRNILDLIPAKDLSDLYGYFFILLEAFESSGHLKQFRIKGLGNTMLVAIDGTDHFSSGILHCDQCRTHTHGDGGTTYSHSMINPVIVAPGKKGVAIALAPEFITNTDGAKKQDCEINAAKRLLVRDGKHLASRNITILADDLYSHEPFCRDVLDAGCQFIFVCKPESHKTLYAWIKGIMIEKIVDSFNGKEHLVWRYQYAAGVPLKEILKKGKKPLLVNFVEVTITERATGKQVYHNAFITSHSLTGETVETIVNCGRARWKTENENNNVLKNYGYYLEHNFGHGEKQLASVLTTLILLSFLMHTILSFTDHQYEAVRLKLVSKQVFFRDISALTKYFPFAHFQQVTEFMRKSLNSQMSREEILAFFQYIPPMTTSPPQNKQAETTNAHVLFARKQHVVG
jgi:hypothetical protein